MVTLLFFAAVAGALTAVTPCVLPVLPALLSASGSGGRRRPAGVVLGLSVTFFLAIVALASVVKGVGLADGTVRTLAILVLAGFGVALLWPAAMQRFESTLAPLSRLGPKTAGDGFGSGLLVGGALGFVYAPCAGPILGAVISVSATQGATSRTVAVALFYVLGSAAMLTVLAKGGRRLLTGHAATLQRASGVVLLVTAVLMAAQLDVRFQTALANDFPSFISNPTGGIERTDAVQNGLAKVRGRSTFQKRQDAARTQPTPPVIRAAATPAPPRGGAPIPRRLPVLGPEPELTQTGQWFNSQPTTLKALKGGVVLVDFWTYTCINCIRTFPALRSLDQRYRRKGLTVLGIHTPEFGFEKDAGNVKQAVRQNRLKYPIVQDNSYGTWDAFGNNAWPTHYLIDAKGQVRYVHIGEGAEAETEAAVLSLLRENGQRGIGDTGPAPAAVDAPSKDITPETFLGTDKAKGFATAPRSGVSSYSTSGKLPVGGFALDGRWKIGKDSALSVGDSRLDIHFNARRAFIVLASKGNDPRKVRVLLDGKPVSGAVAGDDVKGGAVTVREQRLYRLLDLDAARDGRLELKVPDGVRAYSVTFG